MASNHTAQTPQPSNNNLEEVINISSSEPSAKKQPPPTAPTNNGMKIKQDPGVKLTTEDDSDIEILTPSRFPKRPGTSDSNSNNIEGIGNGEDDDIQVTESNTVNPNVDHPHARQYCGVHPFAPNAGNGTTNSNFCSKCYCFVCDNLASECDSWDKNSGGHCNAHDKDDKYVQLREVTLKARGVTTSTPSTLDGEVTLLNSQPPRNPYQQQQSGGGGGMLQQMTSLIHNEFLTRLGTGNDTSDAATARASVEESRRQNTKQKKDMRITEVLVENFKKSVSLSAASVSAKENKVPTQQKMDGDITPLSLHNSFYVEGVKIGWPFPEIMKPQRQMAIHLIKALKNKRHVVLESPTGTGKSAAILCSTLAWQRYHCKMEQAKRQQKSSDDEPDVNSKVGKVKIIYCSRTHSQVAQMVASLKSTPYRPRMAILGSRERLCIHKDIKPRGNNTNEVKNVNVNNECRLRVRNTEKSRKHMLTNMSTNEPYNDEDPPEVMPGDGTEDPIMADGPTEENSNDNFLRRRRTCPHYRQLTTSRVANLAHSTFVPNSKVNCCSVGGKKSKYGAHDIEDLVDFGVDPYLQKEVALYRREPNESFGLSLKSSTGRDRGSFVKEVKKDTPADINGNIKADDKIIRVNGTDVSSSNPATVVNKIKSISTDPLLLDVSRSGSLDGGSGGYSSRAACPYYLSQVLSKDADIIFCPYNYVLDPSIREALGIELENSVVVLDEGHNVESTLREAGSGKFGEFELCELIVMLNNYAITEKSTTNMMDISTSMLSPEESETAFLCDVAHTLLMFVEKIVTKLKTTRISFERNPGAKGAEKVLQDWETFHTSDDTEFEVTFDGPTGRGTNGKCVGCMPFFDRLGLTKQDFDGLCAYVDAFDKHIRGGNENEESNERDRVSNLLDRLSELCHKLKMGINMPEHYYAAILATANGSLAFANGDLVDEIEGNGRFQKKKPRELPLIPPRTKERPERPANPCRDPYCRAKCTDAFNPIRHGDACNGSTPKWECILHLDLLTPGPLMQELSNASRTVVLASGSLSPIPSLCAELNLFPPDDKMSPVKTSQSNTNDKVLPKIQRRLQNQPRPLEADHVVDLEKQLCAVSIGHLPDGSELRVTQKNTGRPDFIPKLGDAIVKIVEGIPSGGVLVFLPSYALLRKCEKQWNPNSFRNNRRSFWSQHEDNIDDGESIWDRLKELKHNVIVEPTGGQDSFEEAKQEYMDSVKNKGGCVLFAVFRGKMSEGISFNDENARGVICVGLPLPSAFALPIKVKKDYNDEQRKLRNRTDLLPGYDWYQQQAYRAIAQALGRCIRHAGDYGAIFLLDARHCDDGSPNNGIPQAHKNLPQWMRRAVKNLSQGTGRSSLFNQSTSNTIPGGWPALQTELKRFFRHAKPHCREVLRKQKEKLSAAQGKKTAVLPTSTTPSQPNKANGRTSSPIDLSSSPEATTSSSNGRIQVVDRQPSTLAKAKATKPNQNQSTAKKKEGTLKAMFQKQEAQGSSLKKRAADGSSSTKSKAAKRANNKGPLQSMFAKQVAAASIDAQQPPSKDTVGDEKDVEDDEDMEEDDNEEEDEESTTSKQPSAPPPAANSFTFKKSPFSDETSTPATEVAASASQLVINQSQTVRATQHTMEEEEHLCVVCEDGKKEIMLLPCKHMCLCKSCASKCLMKQITECPMCRTKIEDSIEVFW